MSIFKHLFSPFIMLVITIIGVAIQMSSITNTWIGISLAMFGMVGIMFIKLLPDTVRSILKLTKKGIDSNILFIFACLMLMFSSMMYTGAISTIETMPANVLLLIACITFLSGLYVNSNHVKEYDLFLMTASILSGITAIALMTYGNFLDNEILKAKYDIASMITFIIVALLVMLGVGQQTETQQPAFTT